MKNTETIDFDSLLARLSGLPTGRRTLVAIVGAPGAGKSTVAHSLHEGLEAASPGRSAVLPMDGYHYDDRLLEQLGRQQRKGAPDTFDVDGLRHMLLRLRENRDARVCVPVFDRDIEIARAGARFVDQSVEILLVEGNYLLLEEAPWSSLAACFDLTVMIDVPLDVLRDRLLARWRSYCLPEEVIMRKVDGNDLPNGERVVAHSRSADLTLAQS